MIVQVCPATRPLPVARFYVAFKRVRVHDLRDLHCLVCATILPAGAGVNGLPHTTSYDPVKHIR